MRAATPLGLALVVAATAAFAPRTGDPLPRSAAPMISVWLDLDRYNVGESAIAHFSTGEDGYVVVFQVDASGNARVIYPALPTDDDFVRGGQESIVRGAGIEGSFVIEGESGTGHVFAAFSPTPFHFEPLTTSAGWSLFALDDPRMATDPIGTLVDVVERITDARYVYDVARYTIGAPSAYVLGWDNGFSYGAGVGSCGLGYGYQQYGYSYGCDSYLGYTNFGCQYCSPPIVIVPVPPAPPPRLPKPGTLGGPATAPRIPLKEPPRFDVTQSEPQVAAGAATAPPAPAAPPRVEPIAPPRAEPAPRPEPPPAPPPRNEPPPRPEPAPAPPPRYEPPPRPEPPPAPQRPPR